MAVNEDRTALWRTPLSTPIINNENGFQDLFKHSEKLLASAVSICRLKGSIECQTGGIITVCEEMQRLIRLAFNETARLEKEVKRQRQTYDEDISFLKERISYLEEKNNVLKNKKDFNTKKAHNSERLPFKPSIIENTREAHSFQVEKAHVLNEIQSSSPQIKSNECEIVNENLEGEENLIDKCIETVLPSKPQGIESHKDFEDDSDEFSLEVSIFDSNKQIESKPMKRKTFSRKSQDSSSSKPRKVSTKKSFSSEKSNLSNKNKEKPIEKKPKQVNPSKGKFKESVIAEKKLDGDKSLEDQGKNTTIVTLAEDQKAEIVVESNDATFDANDSTSSDVFLNPESGLLEMKDCAEPEETGEEETELKDNPKTKEFVEKTTAVKKNSKKEGNTKKTTRKDSAKLKTTKKTKALNVQVIPESPRSGPSDLPINPKPNSPALKEKLKIKNVFKTSSELAIDEREEDALGDMSFLIDISSMISSFVCNSDSEQLELPLMQARERADARKLAGLFNLHISIGNKSDNQSSLILSKTSNSQMPKPGKLDSLLSKLSIAAAKETERLLSKSRNKRKFSSVSDNSCLFDEDVDCQTKKVGNKKAKK